MKSIAILALALTTHAAAQVDYHDSGVAVLRSDNGIMSVSVSDACQANYGMILHVNGQEEKENEWVEVTYRVDRGPTRSAKALMGVDEEGYIYSWDDIMSEEEMRKGRVFRIQLPVAGGEIYEAFDLTGFGAVMDIVKAGCPANNSEYFL